MPMLETLRRSGGLEAIGVEVGISPAESLAAAEALLPALMEGLRQLDEREGHPGGLVALLERHGGFALAHAVMEPGPTEAERGNVLLAGLFGDRELSRVVAGHAAERTGIDPHVMRQVLPRLAMLLGGYVAARVASSGEPEAELRRILADSVKRGPRPPANRRRGRISLR